jgi:ADP-ribose pyrophosphatase
MGSTSRVGNRNRRWILFIVVLSIGCCFFVLSITWQKLSSLSLENSNENNSCLVSFGSYLGTKYERTTSITTSGETISNICLIESPWMRLAQHTVQIRNNNNNENSNGNNAIGRVIDDWLWIDYHDRINVLVQDPKSSRDNPSFLILKQTKYALSSESLAVVGGIIEPNEDPLVAAKREIDEELHVSCNYWIQLGKYRTDVNRGMGWVHPYLARDCIYSTTIQNVNGNSEKGNDVGAFDIERQNVQSMTLSEVKDAVKKEKFVEVQWSNTVALAMLHIFD